MSQIARRTRKKARRPTRSEVFGDLGLVPPVITSAISPLVKAEHLAVDEASLVLRLARQRVFYAPVYAWVSLAATAGVGLAYWQREKLAKELDAAADLIAATAEGTWDMTAEAAKTAADAVAQGVEAVANVTATMIESARRGLIAGALALDKKTSGAGSYLDTIFRVADEEKVRASLLIALGARETWWGRIGSRLYHDGAGDWVVRGGHWLPAGMTYMDRNGNPATADGKNSMMVRTVPAGWSRGKANPPFAIPKDGRGWGRGLMQIDYDGVIASGIDPNDPYQNIQQGARTFQGKRKVLKSTIPEPYLSVAALAAYNCGEKNVLTAYNAAYRTGGTAAGMAAVDKLTTGGDYSKWVLALSAKLEPDDKEVMVAANAAAAAGGTAA